MKIIVGLSWWPDSMFLTYLLWKKIWKQNLILAHFNHNFRKESNQEETQLKKIFKNWNLEIERYTWNCFTEKCLRQARYDFFKKIWWWKYWLALGHNLTDRIETSFLNLLRWGWIDGFLNMKKVDYNQKTLRPLLNIPKIQIQQKCDALQIPYFIDQTNFDERISLRNLLRNRLISLFENINFNFYYSFQKLYSQIEEIYPHFNILEYLKKIDENLYLVKFPEKYQKFFIKQLLDCFWVRNLRAGVIDEILQYKSKAKWWGFKQYWNLKFYKKHNKIYLEILKIWQKNKKLL